MPAPGSQIQIGSEWPQPASPLVPPRYTAAQAPTPMKKAWPSDTCPATPLSRLRPRAAMASTITIAMGRSQSPSPRNRTTGIWLMTGSSKGSRNSTARNAVNTAFWVQVGSICVSWRYAV